MVEYFIWKVEIKLHRISRRKSFSKPEDIFRRNCIATGSFPPLVNDIKLVSMERSSFTQGIDIKFRHIYLMNVNIKQGAKTGILIEKHHNFDSTAEQSTKLENYK